jgi:hypothetical protein
MASSGTLLSDLDGGGSAAAPQGDTDLVRKIFADMNQGGGGGSMIMSPNPNTTAPISMDSAPATSHIIGKDHPTPGDFAAAMHGQGSRLNDMMPQQMQQPGPMMNPMAMASPSFNVPVPFAVGSTGPIMTQGSNKNMYARIADELKTPILVTLIVFAFSLPFLNVLFSHYVPSLLKPTGDLTTVGLLVKSAIAGTSFWVLQRVIAPLVSL